jgi:hypothetical protein
MPPYVKLSKDVIWGVRKGSVPASTHLHCIELTHARRVCLSARSVVESMVVVCESVPADVRSSVFMPMFERFAKDVSGLMRLMLLRLFEHSARWLWWC